MPSLGQLDQAVRQFQAEFPDTETIIVVDATFGHRIDASEKAAFDEAVAHGELVSPPAGAIGRGDAFVLRVAERVHGQVLSNDSFQEFHGEHQWLFDEGRLIGGKPVPGVGWIFTLRTPVRGPRSRAATSAEPDAKGGGRRTKGATARPKREASSPASKPPRARAAANASSGDSPAGAGAGAGPGRRRRRRTGSGRGDPEVQAAIVAATEEAITPHTSPAESSNPKRRGGRRSPATSTTAAVNDPLTFLTFVSEHPLGTEVDGVISTFVSHGAMVDVGEMRCYVPLSGLGTPAPKSAREVLEKGSRKRFVLVALDPPRRGAQLALADTKKARKVATATKATKAPAKATRVPAKATKAPAPAPAKATKAPARRARHR